MKDLSSATWWLHYKVTLKSQMPRENIQSNSVVFRAVVPKVSKARTINVIILYLIGSSPEESP